MVPGSSESRIHLLDKQWRRQRPCRDVLLMSLGEHETLPPPRGEDTASIWTCRLRSVIASPCSESRLLYVLYIPIYSKAYPRKLSVQVSPNKEYVPPFILTGILNVPQLCICQLPTALENTTNNPRTGCAVLPPPFSLKEADRVHAER